MKITELKKEIDLSPSKGVDLRDTYYVRGFDRNPEQSNVLRRADAVEEEFLSHRKHVYENDLILGSLQGIFGGEDEADSNARNRRGEIGGRNFWTGVDHFAPNYERLLAVGIGGRRAAIEESLERYAGDEAKQEFLLAAKKTLDAMAQVLLQYADEADKMGLTEAAETCRHVSEKAPETFRQALQLTYIVHNLFIYEGRYAMAFGRLDQYLSPFYTADIAAGRLTPEEALDLVACALYKIGERRLIGYDDVCNIAIGGVRPEDGHDATNELSYIILNAVNICHIPGPNLSARINSETSLDFIDECLKVIGTGLGYPALMNDGANIPALHRYGIYSLEDCRNYCMVGCIENFIQGKQPPWSDGRYNSPKYLELALNDGVCALTGERKGPATGRAEDFATMDDFMAALEAQMRYGADKYVENFLSVFNFEAADFQQPFLSLFCDNCVERGLDICMGGARYPSAHGACAMGIGTMSDSLRAIEKLVYEDKVMTLAKMRDVLLCDFDGYEDERRLMLDCPKYGNDDDTVDKWAVWFVDKHAEIFDQYKLLDGGAFYIAIASNTANIGAGREIGATPDGRHARDEVSDAASPTHGVDVNGPTAAFCSLAKPDYSKSATGTVVNQKYPPAMFENEEDRRKLGVLIKTYFDMGGQEVQINSVSREVLADAMVNPDKYRSMVVRVSGFSAYYTNLGRDVQTDILRRTEHQSV